jgi:hypothetical protein
MPQTYAIGLPFSHKPKFPNKCVSCRAENPTATIRVSETIGGWLSWITFRPATRHVVHAPACVNCYRLDRLHRAVFWFIVLLSLFAVHYWLWPVVRPMFAGPFQPMSLMILVIVSLSPIFYIDVFIPRVFSITLCKEGIDYEFRSMMMTYLFLAENLDAPWIREGGCNKKQ